jgi:hypothetical protein
MTVSGARARIAGVGKAARKSSGHRAKGVLSAVGQVRCNIQSAVGRLPGVISTARREAGRVAVHVPEVVATARREAGRVAEHVPEVVATARVGAKETATTLQAMPDPTLRQMAAASAGVAAGLYLAGAPRPITLAAIAPALIVGGAIVTRTNRIGQRAHAH